MFKRFLKLVLYRRRNCNDESNDYMLAECSIENVDSNCEKSIDISTDPVQIQSENIVFSDTKVFFGAAAK